MEEKNTLLRQIPSVDQVLGQESLRSILNHYPRQMVVDAVRKVLDRQRKQVLTGKLVTISHQEILSQITAEVKKKGENQLKPVINATGVVVHTNLGRSLLAQKAIEHLVEVAQRYNNLEYDLNQGKRGSRYSHVEALLCELTGAEAAMVVNNNAGAVFLTLNTLAYGKKVIVSRGELIEIGGSFRIPDVMARSGAILTEVGTTNRTHIYDYEQAIDEQTALIMKVHKSNYKIIGFTKEVGLKKLVTLGQKYNLPVIEDLGSGNFVDLTKYGLEKEPLVQKSIADGADIVSFSGDKLLGGPQAGIILGKRKFIEPIKKNPLNRALRIDKLTLAGLESTLRLYQDEKQALKEIPTLHLLTLSPAYLRQQAMRLKRLLQNSFDEKILGVEIKRSVSKVGGGALPGQELPTFVVAIKPIQISVLELEQRLRVARPPLVARIEEDFLCLDVRTIQNDELKLIPQIIKQTLDKDHDQGN